MRKAGPNCLFRKKIKKRKEKKRKRDTRSARPAGIVRATTTTTARTNVLATVPAFACEKTT